VLPKAKSATRALNEKQKVMLYKSYFGGKKGAALAGHGERGRFCAPCGMSVRFTAKQAHQHTHTHGSARSVMGNDDKSIKYTAHTALDSS